MKRLFYLLGYIVVVYSDCYFVDHEGYGVTADTTLDYKLLDNRQMCYDWCAQTSKCSVTMYQRYGCHLLQRPLIDRVIVTGLKECKELCYYNDECGVTQLVRGDQGIDVCWLYMYSDIKQTIYYNDVVSFKHCDENDQDDYEK
ncbi:hypothetical protein LOTGIDRAFT_152434 [Lottia gigantea]|uniref:Apple domain-containing protein n=1 Tax=Lottia gigantea TaxID=225164 RepID=V4BI30_LOTGI|nr:hypothetical protein LOTGIDRAFT_152434 [Lottia gigantea]ESP05577.1 hypothetical protein LOTGIDRAFT_152434 [Lottia gigantea]